MAVLKGVFPYLDGQMLLGERSEVLGGKHAGHPWWGPGQGHLPGPPLLHLLHHLPIDELPLLLPGSQRPAQSFSIFQGISQEPKHVSPKSHKMPHVSVGEPHANKGFKASKHFTTVCHSPPHDQTSQNEANGISHKVQGIMPYVTPGMSPQILTTSGTRTQRWDAYCLSSHKNSA